jgi:hypothetical protein
MRKNVARLTGSVYQQKQEVNRKLTESEKSNEELKLSKMLKGRVLSVQTEESTSLESKTEKDTIKCIVEINFEEDKKFIKSLTTKFCHVHGYCNHYGRECKVMVEQGTGKPKDRYTQDQIDANKELNWNNWLDTYFNCDIFDPKIFEIFADKSKKFGEHRGKVVGVRTYVCNKIDEEHPCLQIEITYNFRSDYMINWANTNMRRLRWDSFYCHLLSMSPRQLETEGDKKHAYTFSEKVDLSNNDSIDFFISHSWEDDGIRKYLELTKFVDSYAQKKGRYPTFWLDKVCMDQTDTSAATTFLPINIGACKRMLVFMSKTYMTRLWCIWELYTLFTFCQETMMFERVVILQIDQTDPVDALRKFKLEEATCFSKEEEESLRKIIDNIGGQKLIDAFSELASFIEKKKGEKERNCLRCVPYLPQRKEAYDGSTVNDGSRDPLMPQNAGGAPSGGGGVKQHEEAEDIQMNPMSKAV